MAGGNAVALATAAMALALTAVTGCESESEREAEQAIASGAPTPVCVEQADDVALPASFPSDFPLPPGSVVYAAEHRSEGRTIVYAVVDRDVKAVLKQMQDAPAKAGFTATDGEVEDRDAESNWEGNGYIGRWAIREVAECPSQTSVTVLSART